MCQKDNSHKQVVKMKFYCSQKIINFVYIQFFQFSSVHLFHTCICKKTITCLYNIYDKENNTKYSFNMLKKDLFLMAGDVKINPIQAGGGAQFAPIQVFAWLC